VSALDERVLPALRRVAGRRELCALAGAATLVVVAEAERGSVNAPTGAWLVAECVVAAAGLLAARRARELLRPSELALAAAVFAAVLVLVREHAGATGDVDVNGVYAREGNSLLHGVYPHSEYPPGAVLLFTAEAWIGGGHTRIPNAAAMVLCQALLVGALAAFRTERSGWIAALVAFWPASIYFWLYRFDLLPAALLVVALLLAHRGRWGWSGLAFGVATAVKWTPAISAVVLALWLISRGEARAAGRHAAGWTVGFGLLNLPFLVWAPARVLDAYTMQVGRTITAESFAYPPLKLLGLAHVNTRSGLIWDPAGAPHWASSAAVALQIALVVAAGAAAVLAREDRRAALAAAAVAPCLFLLSNRVFSGQYAVTLAAGWGSALCLLRLLPRTHFLLAATAASALGANALVYPARIRLWFEASTLFFVLGFACSGVLLWLARRQRLQQLAQEATSDGQPRAAALT